MLEKTVVDHADVRVVRWGDGSNHLYFALGLTGDDGAIDDGRTLASVNISPEDMIVLGAALQRAGLKGMSLR